MYTIAGEYDDTAGKTHGFVLINGVYPFRQLGKKKPASPDGFAG